MRRLDPRACAVLLGLAATGHGAPMAEPPGGYVGVAACAGCHAEAAARWRASRHARSSDALTPAERARRACQACHATGDAPAAAAVRPAVECEACHGAGGSYAHDD